MPAQRHLLSYQTVAVLLRIAAKCLADLLRFSRCSVSRPILIVITPAIPEGVTLSQPSCAGRGFSSSWASNLPRRINQKAFVKVVSKLICMVVLSLTERQRCIAARVSYVIKKNHASLCNYLRKLNCCTSGKVCLPHQIRGSILSIASARPGSSMSLFPYFSCDLPFARPVTYALASSPILIPAMSSNKCRQP